MVAIFTGAGTGFERGSGSVLGSAGLLGSSTLGRGGEQLFLNAATGNLLINRQDEFLLGLGPDATISRTYNSLGDLSDENADNWRYSTQRRITNYNAGASVQRVGADGAVITYTWDNTKSLFVATDGGGAYDTLKLNGSTWTRTDGDSQVTETYALEYGSSTSWRITSQADTDGNTLTFTYNANSNLLDRITTQDGSFAHYWWNGNKIENIETGYTDLATGLTKVWNGIGYFYDAQGRLDHVNVDLSPEDDTIADGNKYTTTYTYDGTSNRVASIGQSDGSRVDITYDGSNRVATIVQTAATGVTRTTNISYSTTAGITTTTLSDSVLGQLVVLLSDSQGQLTEIQMPATVAGGPRQYTQFTYNSSGDVTRVAAGTFVGATYTENHATNYTNFVNGNWTTRTDSLANVTTRTYGSKNELQTETTSGADADTDISSPTATHNVRYAYDGENHLRYRVSAEGYVTQYNYDGPGNLTSTVTFPEQFFNLGTLNADPAQWTGQFDTWVSNIADKSSVEHIDNTYDGRGGLLSSTAYALATSGGVGLTTDNYTTSNYVYDQAGRLLSRNVQGRNTETFVYDGLGRLTASVDINGGTISYVYDDGHTRTIVTFLATGLIQTSTYDKAGELVSFTEATTPNLAPNLSPDWVTSGLTSTLTNIHGQEATQYTVQAGAPNGAVYAFSSAAAGDTITMEFTLQAAGPKNYDFLGIFGNTSGSWGAVADTTIEVLSGPGAGTRETGGQFKISGLSTTEATRVRVTRRFVSAEASVVCYQFVGEYFNGQAGDSLIVGSALLSKRSSAQPGAVTGTSMYGYDQLGRLRWQMDATGKKSYILYDKAGRRVADISGDGDMVEYAYNADNRLVATVAYNTKVNSSLLGSLNNEVAAADILDFRPTLNSASDLWTWHVYDTEGHLRQTVDGDGSTTILTYDGEGKLTQTREYYEKLSVSTYKTITANSLTAIAVVTTPAADASRDAITRNFYAKDGRLIGTVDAELNVTKIIYDKAGQKVEEIAFLNATTASVSTASFNAIVAGVTLSATGDRHTRYVYNGQGQLRFVVDSNYQVAETRFNNSGEATSVIRYATALSSSTSDFTFDNVKALVAAGGFASTNDRWNWLVYDSAGRVVQTIDSYGLTTINTYNAAGQLIKAVSYANNVATATVEAFKTTPPTGITYPYPIDALNDRVTRSYYDGAGVLRYVVDGEGYVTRRTEDAEGRLTLVERFANAATATDATTIDTLHSWVISSGGVSANSTTAYDVDGRVSTVTDGEGNVTRSSYNINGTLQSQTVADGTSDASATYFVYDGAGRVTEQHRAYGTSAVSITRFSYDGLGNVLTVTDPDNHVTTQTFDRLGQQLTSTNALSGVTSFQYDAFGNVVKSTDARGNSTYNYFDNLNRLIFVRDAEDYLTQTIYTTFSDVDQVIRRVNKANNTAAVGILPTVTIDANDANTRFEYDRLGRVTKTTDAQGYFEQYTLSAFGNRTSVLNKLGGTITNIYDRRGLLVSEVLPMASVNSAGTQVAATVTNKFAYDARGNRTQMIEAFGLAEARTTNFAYDKIDRLITRTLDAVTTVAYNDFTSTTTVTVTTTNGVVPTESYVYDRRGNLIQVTDANGAKTLSYYDKLGRKTAEVGPLGTLKAWTYDAAGNMLTERVYGDAVAVPGSPGGSPPNPINGANYRETVYTYDVINRLSTTSVASVLVGTWVSGSNGVSRSTVMVSSSLAYDANGNVIASTDANLNIVYSSYDKLGHKTAQVDQEGYLTKWTYDSEGNVKSETRFANKYTGTLSPLPQNPTVTADAINDRTTNFTYDRNGHRLTETRTGVVAWTVSSSNGALTAASTNSVVTYTYNGLGQVLTKAETTGDAVTYAYDQTGRLTKETRATYSDQTSTNVTPEVLYSYNGLNNLSRTQQGEKTAIEANTTVGRITTYVYSAGGRLASMTDPAGGAHSYNYDAAGNLVGDSYYRTVFMSMGMPVEASEAILYRRDLLGRVVTQTIGDLLNNVRGDSQNTQYDAYGEVSQRGVNGLWQESFTYNNRGLVEKTNTGDGVWRFYVYDKQGNQVLGIESEGNDYSSTALSTVLTALGTYAGSAYLNGVNTTISIYDKRNQVTQARMPQRETTAVGSSLTSINTSQAYNAFGEIASQTDALAKVTTLTYNTMGRLTQKVMPLVSVTSEQGVVSNVTPTEKYYYDLAGRVVAYADPNRVALGGTNAFSWSRLLLAGSGYGGADALAIKEFHADPGIVQTGYDVFGDARKLTDALNQIETRAYDNMGRATTIVRRTGLQELFTYDLLGQRLTRTLKDTVGTTVGSESNRYDLQGRVTLTQDLGGDQTTFAYAWQASLTNSGMSGATVIGGWTTTTTQWAQLGSSLWKTKSETADVHGLTTTETDLGGHAINYTYDRAGRLTQKVGTSGAIVTTLTNTFYNTALVATVVDGTTGMTANGITSTFKYDAMGRRTGEKYTGTVYKSLSDASYTSLTSSTQTLQDATIVYDALGRMTSYTNKNAAAVTDMTVSQYYDAAGNIRHTATMYPNLVAGGSTNTDRWFAYDSMNRMTIVDGQLLNGWVTRSTDGIGATLTYDVAGNRRTKVYSMSPSVLDTETYYYDADNQLTDVYEQGTYVPYGLRARTVRDIRGRVTEYYEYYNTTSGATLANHRWNITYNARGQASGERNFQWIDGAADIDATITNTYDNYGNMTYTVSNNAGITDTSQAWTFGAWYDGAVVTHSTYDKDYYGSNTLWNSDQYYDGLGRLHRAFIADQKPRAVHFALNADNEVVSSVQNNEGTDDPRAYHRFVSGKQVGEYTNDRYEDTRNYDYDDFLEDKFDDASGSTRFHRGQPAASGGEFGTSGYDPINGLTAGVGQNSRSRYVVQSGDTLQGIAGSLWGDSSLWYKLAEANGLSADSALTSGQGLAIPLNGPSNRNNADMFRPYDASSAVGDLSPTSAKPPKKNKCGAFGQILLVAIAVAVTVVLTAGVAAVAAGTTFGSAFGAVTGGSLATLGATTTATGALAGGLGAAGAIGVAAAGGALGSIVSQGVGVATGIQNKFSWKGVALSALSAGISQGVGSSGVFNGFNGTVRAGLNGAASNALTQGIGVVTGLQDKFDWAAVAAAGVGAGVGRAVGGAGFMKNLNGFGQRVVSNMAVGIADAASRSVINGTDFGDNLIAALPDVIGQTIGGAVADGVAGMTAPGVSVPAARGKFNIPGGSLPALLLASDLGIVQMISQGYDSLKAYISTYVAPDAPADEIVVTGIRKPPQHGTGWKIADAFGLHSNFFQSFWNGNSGVSNRVPVYVGQSRVQSGDRTSSQYRSGPSGWAGAPYGMKVTSADVARMNAAFGTPRASFMVAPNQYSFARPPGVPNTRISTSDVIGYVGTGYEIGGRSTIDFGAEVFMNDPSKVLLGTRVVGHSFPIAEGTVRYFENSREGHSMFASTTGAINSTLVPVLAGAGAGFFVGGTFGDGFLAIPGAIAGGYVGYKYGDELNAQGITTAEYFESGRAREDATRHVLATQDSTGMTLSEYLDHVFNPRTDYGF